MKKAYSFTEGVLSVCSLPRTRKYILPVLLAVFAILFIYFKVKESAYTDSQIKESLQVQQRLSLRTQLHATEKSILEAEYLLNKSIETGNINGKEVQAILSSSDSVLDKISLNTVESELDKNSLEFINLLKQKQALLQKASLENQLGNKQKATATLVSEESKQVKDGLVETGNRLAAEIPLTALTVAAESKNKLFQFHTWMVYLSAFVLTCLLLVFIYAKTKLSTDSEKKVKDSATVKENFLANMSHEIRTPLNAVLGFSNILRNTDLNEEQKEYIEVIQNSGDNLLSIVNDILDLSKIEAGMLRIEEAPFRVSEIINTVEAMLKPKVEEKNLKLVVKVDSDVPEFVLGDAVRLSQILVNLVNNAVKFTEDGGIYLRVTPVKTEGEKVTLEFLVRDTGIGISEQKQKTIFDRFEQAEASTTRRFGGTGLGLSIVKNLVDLKKGTISLYSQPGIGTSFTVELPFKITDEVVKISETRKSKINLPQMKTETKILIAEDNVMNQRLIKHLMKNWNFNYDLVFNGAQAIEALKKQSYGLVLMDIQMPEMDGYSATAHIRSVMRSDIPIIAMTAHAMSGEKEKCLKAGMTDYLSKPINEDLLFEMIQKHAVSTQAASPVYEKEAVASVNQAKVIDLNVIDKYSRGDVEFRKELIREFINTVPAEINSLEAAIKQSNYQRIKAIAHDMKTTVHIMGLTLLIGHLLQQIEIFAYTNTDMSSINSLFSDVKNVCMQAVQEAGRLVA
jgi:CheY-like chemotaxis protein/nitrogen-specific signal transduction histidine kinase